MRIEDVRRHPVDGQERLTGTVVWEAHDRPPQDLYFGVPAEHGEQLSDGPEALLTALAPIAAVSGERRVVADGACPSLAEGVRTAIAWLHHWYPTIVAPVEIQAEGHRVRHPPDLRVAGSLLSGGIDSLSLLAANHGAVPPGHPARIDHCLHVEWAGSQQDPPHDDRRPLREATEDAGVELTTLESNYRAVFAPPSRGRLPLWRNVLHGAAFAGCAHALSNRFRSVTIASSHHVGTIGPSGSHPLLDPNFSSGYLRFAHEPNLRSRFEKTRLVAAWPAGLRTLRVCVGPQEQRRQRQNCGRCEKCVRTAATLRAVGRDPVIVPGLADVSPDDIARVGISTDFVAGFWRSIAEGLREQRDEALADAVDQRLRRYAIRRQLRPVKQAARRLSQMH